jgi:hypothetical protein
MLHSRSVVRPITLGAALLLGACGGGDASGDAAQAATDSAAMADAATTADAPAMDMFVSSLSGAAERPEPVATKAQAEATYMVYADSIGYVVNALDLMGATAVHIHRGGADEAGPVMATLFSSADGADFANGTLAMGTITRETALAEGVTFDDLRTAVSTGAAYTNVHTKANPKGELRAQTTMGTM